MLGAPSEGMLVIKPTTAFKHNSFAIHNNTFHTTGGSKRQIVVDYVPDDFVCNQNVFSAGGTFSWGNGRPLSLEQWKKTTGQDSISTVGNAPSIWELPKGLHALKDAQP